MPGRVSSPAFIGRQLQLDALRTALIDLATHPKRVVLISGEAGIGKTRLLDELARDLEADPPSGPVRVIRGSCVELGGGDLPFAPVLDLLDALSTTGATTLALRDELAGTSTDDRLTSGRGRVFVAIRDALVEAAGNGDLVVCIDDLHWADRSTLELLSFLAPRLGDARVLLVLAYRSDELHRRHPLRPVLAELERGAVIARLEVTPLSAAEVGAQVAGILGVTPARDLLDRVAALADGNPFHAEELVALGVGANVLPRSLRDVLLARLDRLDDPAREVLGRAAVVGRDVDEALLVAVSDRGEDEVRAGLRGAVEYHVLEPAPDGRRYRFRHALLREAVRDDILPSERFNLHRRIAQELSARPALAASSPAAAAAELAYHWSEAGDPVRAYPALVEAARTAAAAHAWTEAATANERAAAIAASGAVALAPIDLAEMLMKSALLTNFGGDSRRALALGRNAIETDDGSDARRSGVLWNWLGQLANDAGDFPLVREAVETAAALIPVDPPSRDRANAIMSLGMERMISGLCIEPLHFAAESLAMCRVVRAPDVEAAAQSTRVMCLAGLGREEEARVALAAGLELCAEFLDENIYVVGAVYGNGCVALLMLGDFSEAVRFVDVALVKAAELGVERAWAPWIEPSAAEALFFVGEWAAAAARLERVDVSDVVGFTEFELYFARAEQAVARGDEEAFRAAVADMSAGPKHDYFEGRLELVQASAAMDATDPEAAVRHAEAALGHLEHQEDVLAHALARAVALGAYADLAGRERAGRNADAADAFLPRIRELVADARRLAEGTFYPESASPPWIRAIAAVAEAEASRAEGLNDPGPWSAAAANHADVGTWPSVAYCRYREGEAHLGAGDQAAARTALVEAHRLATRIGMVPLLGRIDGLARRARVSLDPATGATPASAPAATIDPWGLSIREREVLVLVADGRTNRQIGDALFISEKTASVHVTHILVKLGVGSRTEAALLAARAGVRPD